MTKDILASIGDTEFLTTIQILEVLDFAIGLIEQHPSKARDVLASLHHRIAVDDACWERTHSKEANHACH